jgi:hypothetical protein
MNDDFKLECKEDEGFAGDVTTNVGLEAGRPEAEGRSNYVFRIDHRQKVQGKKERDGGPAGDRVNAKMAELLDEYKIDEIIANRKYAHIFKGKVAEQVRSIQIGQYLAAVHTEMVCDAKAALTDEQVRTYSWDRAMDAAKCFFGKRKNKMYQLGRQASTEEREQARAAPPRRRAHARRSDGAPALTRRDCPAVRRPRALQGREQDPGPLRVGVQRAGAAAGRPARHLQQPRR